MNSKYTMHFNVKCYMTDYNHNLRPAAFLDCAQDIATDAAAEINLGDPTLRPLGCVWVVARMHTKFLRPVKFNEKVSMSSWHKGIKGVNFLRDYQLCGADGVPAVNSTSSWIVMDMKTRMLSRDASVWEILNREPQSAESAIEEPSPKIVMPKGGDIRLIGTHKVQWSDVDFNKHANNVKYTVWTGLQHLAEGTLHQFQQGGAPRRDRRALPCRSRRRPHNRRARRRPSGLHHETGLQRIGRLAEQTCSGASRLRLRFAVICNGGAWRI